MGPARASAKAGLVRLLRRGLERAHGSGTVALTEYPRDPRARWGWDGSAVLGGVEQFLADHVGSYESWLAEVLQLHDWAATIPRRPEPGQPGWENDWWGTIDALMQCAALRRRNPRTYLEIGSGFSTLFAARAIRDFGLQTTIVSVDAAPRLDVDAHCGQCWRQPLERVVDPVLDSIAPGDIVLLDGSHVSLMNTDATVFFLELMPRLPPGVLVGIDDVFLPWDYPPTWVDRPYGEQYLLAAFLLGGAHGYEVRFPGWWIVERSPLASRLGELWPLVENRFGRHATSFWLERVGE